MRTIRPRIRPLGHRLERSPCPFHAQVVGPQGIEP